MAEWQPRHYTVGNFDNRLDYHFLSGAEQEYLKEKAFAMMKEILAIHRPTDHVGRWQYAKDGVATSQLSVTYGENDDETEYYAGEDGLQEIHLERIPATTLATIRTESFYGQRENNALREAAELTVHETLQGRNTDFMSQYVFERYRGNVLHATVQIRDHIEIAADDTRNMTPYDFEEFERQLATVKAVRTGVTVRREKEGEAA